MNNLLKCYGVDYSYADGGEKTPILKNLELTIGRGESVAILGKSGCGKSTLLNILGGIDKPNQGDIFLNQTNLKELNEEQITRFRAKHLGFVYQFHHLLKDFSALDNVAMPLFIRGEKHLIACQKSSALLSNIGLGQRLAHLPSQLSGGERQRVAIARAVITSPDCLLADEPSGNLDTKTADSVIRTLISLQKNQNAALVIATHDEKIASKMQRMLILENGKLNEV